ncbi:TnpA transposase [Pseudomonas syringae]|uniref:TnpA transposase n=1 Tax=Pseudomonas syringae TaxID=317 RepID=A0A2K4X2Z4_PSESX|nr:TnpA transposase [Pseudomonas syringae]
MQLCLLRYPGYALASDSVLAASIKQGTVTASLMLRKLGSYPRQNGLAVALRELGRIERTLFILDWLQSAELRRRVHAGLNKGEARNACSCIGISKCLCIKLTLWKEASCLHSDG